MTKKPNVALHLNSDQIGEEHVIVFLDNASMDMNCPPAHRLPEYFNKHETGITDLNPTAGGCSGAYSTAIRIGPSEVRGWE